MTYAVKAYVQEVLGPNYINFRPPELSESFKETTSNTPVFFILSAGVDPTRVKNTYINKYVVSILVYDIICFVT